MFSGKISEVMARQIEKKIAEGDLSNLTDSELSQLAIEFVGDAPPSHVPRETVIEILSQQQDITNWRNQVKQKAIDAAKNKISQVATSVDPKMMDMIKTQFGEWLKNSGYNTAELTAKLDKNLDGIISKDELNSFIRELSGSEPPAWVSDTVVAIIDNDGDGKIRIDELWAYLGTIGFEVPISPAEEEGILDEALENELAEIDDAVDELEEQQIVNQTQESENIAIENEKHQDDIKVASEVVSQTKTTPDEDTNILVEAVVETSIEKCIELLEKTRLHSEASSVIENSTSGICTISVERVERNLMVLDSYRGGMTVIGLLDNGPYTVAALFEPEFNEAIEGSVGQRFTFSGTVFDWSSGLRQAKLKGKDLKKS